MNMDETIRQQQIAAQDADIERRKQEAFDEYRRNNPDGPAASADEATSSPASPVTASAGTHEQPGIDFTFHRPHPGTKNLETPVLGHHPYIVVQLTDDSVVVKGGGINNNPTDEDVAGFLMGAADVLQMIAQNVTGERDDA